MLAESRHRCLQKAVPVVTRAWELPAAGLEREEGLGKDSFMGKFMGCSLSLLSELLVSGRGAAMTVPLAAASHGQRDFVSSQIKRGLSSLRVPLDGLAVRWHLLNFAGSDTLSGTESGHKKKPQPLLSVSGYLLCFSKGDIFQGVTEKREPMAIKATDPEGQRRCKNPTTV